MAEVQVFEFREVAYLWGDGACQLVVATLVVKVAEVYVFEFGEVAYLRGV